MLCVHTLEIRKIFNFDLFLSVEDYWKKETSLKKPASVNIQSIFLVTLKLFLIFIVIDL